ncbi:hypothetical protein NA57DRAFT_54218 [Rhizodiscina lignyota]|uniref:Uncharacterized protein n=1 Tax=Rhizodiscina lignyota TaxID=1504668 RepID=A0A9P4IQC0_9PEZI|nr:hypothetical protein NA57DRAFT_54218 [Rhizodiscina lignyota]
MKYYQPIILLFTFLCGSPWLNVNAQSQLAKRASGFSLYAYGANISGSRVFYNNGGAYCGPFGAPSAIAAARNVTFSISGISSIVFAPENSTANGTSGSLLYIPNTDSGPQPVGFNNATSTERNNTGFGFYGPWLFHVASNGDIEMNWYALPTNQTDIFRIEWGSSAVSSTQPSATLVALRTAAPVVGSPKE